MRPEFPSSFRSLLDRRDLGWVVLRVALSGLIAAHGWARLLAGGVVPFGSFLDAQGFPFGLAIAAMVTAAEIIGSLSLLLGRLVLPVSLLFAAIYTMGIVLVHSKSGWFVVGLGRNGSEYSVLLIVCLLCVGLQNRGKPSKA